MFKISLNRKKIAMPLVLMLLLAPLMLANIGSGAAMTILRVDPPELEVRVCTQFSVDVVVDTASYVYQWGFIMGYDTNIMDAISAGVYSPFVEGYKQISDENGYVWVEGRGGPVNGTVKLAHIEFHCTGLGGSTLQIGEWYLYDYEGHAILVDAVQNGYVSQTSWYWKPEQVDYAPSGVPDFDQKQDAWISPKTQKWTHCGPVALANSLWWLDSEFEPNPVPQPTPNDGFPLVKSYGSWDDHDPRNVGPLVQNLAYYVDTNGIRTGANINGTSVMAMTSGIEQYLKDRGLFGFFYVKLLEQPMFSEVAFEVQKCEDVILLLGFWQEMGPGMYVRIGGHYVTVAGVDMVYWRIGISDPFYDNAESGGMGRVLPVAPHPPQHPGLHNDTLYVSHDIYLGGTSPSPGNPDFGIPGYNYTYIQNFAGQNFLPGELWPYLPGPPVFTEVEYAIVVSPYSWYFKGWPKGYTDYAPSGVPDFDQKQNGVNFTWKNPYPPVNTWSWCGPTSVANSLWWLDSEFEPNPMPPTTVNDNFPLVQSYIQGRDDHDPLNVPRLIEDLAWYMDTDGRHSGTQYCGTNVYNMTFGIQQYMKSKGIDWKFHTKLVPRPDFYYIEDEIYRCEDVVLLLGFWQYNYYEQMWYRVGGHYITVAGIASNDRLIAISDPFLDNAEFTPHGNNGSGVVIPPSPHPHGTTPPYPEHNNATFVSHDIYTVGLTSSPGGMWGLMNYPWINVIPNFNGSNFSPEFMPLKRGFNPMFNMTVEIEFAVVTSCETGRVASGSEDGNVYVHDFNGNLMWKWFEEAYCVSVAFDNEAKYLAAGWRSGQNGLLGFFDVNAVTGGGLNPPLWTKSLAISESYDGGWMGRESKSVDVKYNSYNQYYIVAAAHNYGLNLYDQWGNLIWQYFDEEGPETIVRISQDGNYIVCADYNTGEVHYFSHLRDGVPGWSPVDGMPLWNFGAGIDEMYAFWIAISGLGDYVAVSVYQTPVWIDPMIAGVVVLNKTGAIVMFHFLNKGGFVRVDMPCHGRSVVSVNDNPQDQGLGCDLLYFSDGGDGWDSGDNIPMWNFWPGKELGSGQNPLDDFYTVSISENGDYVATGGIPHNTYLLTKAGSLQQKIGLMPGAIQSVDLTFTGKYGASVDNAGDLWFFSKDSGFLWSWFNQYEAPFRCVAVSKIYPCMFPYPDHDVAITRVRPWKTIVGQGYSTRVDVNVTNDGDFAETVDITVQAIRRNALGIITNFTEVKATGISLNIGETKMITLRLNTTDLSRGNYTVYATASIVQDEIDVYDNTFVNGLVRVMIPGDVDGSKKVDMFDIGLICAAYLAKHISDPSDPRYCQYWHTTPCGGCPHDPNYDIDDNGKFDMMDIGIACTHYYEKET